MGKIVPSSELRSLRLERLKRSIAVVLVGIEKEPLHEGGPHPGYIEFGRLLYESATRDFKPCEIPKPLRPCPWLFVLAELARAYPHIVWSEQAMAEHVQRYLATLAQPQTPVIPETKPLDFDAAQHVEGA